MKAPLKRDPSWCESESSVDSDVVPCSRKRCRNGDAPQQQQQQQQTKTGVLQGAAEDAADVRRQSRRERCAPLEEAVADLDDEKGGDSSSDLRNAVRSATEAYCEDGDVAALSQEIARTAAVAWRAHRQKKSDAFQKRVARRLARAYYACFRDDPRALAAVTRQPAELGTVFAETWISCVETDTLEDACRLLGSALEVVIPSQKAALGSTPFRRGFSVSASLVGKIGPIFRNAEKEQGDLHGGVVRAFASTCRHDVLGRASRLVAARVQTIAGKWVQANDRAWLVQANYGTYAHFIVMFSTLVRADDALRDTGRAAFADAIFDRVLTAASALDLDQLLHDIFGEDNDGKDHVAAAEWPLLVKTLATELLLGLPRHQLEQLALHAFLRYSPASNEKATTVLKYALAIHLVDACLKAGSARLFLAAFQPRPFLTALTLWLREIPVVLFQIGRLHDMLHGPRA